MKRNYLKDVLIIAMLLLSTIVNAQWVQIGNDIDGEAEYDYLGYSVSLSSDGNIVAIGAINNCGNGNNAGHVRIFENISGTWTQIGNDIEGEAANDYSGFSVSLSFDGTVVAIGAVENDGSGSNAGHVRVFKNISGTWTQIGNDIDGEATDDRSGRTVSLSSDGSIVAIGARFNDGNGTDAGHVRVFQNNAGSWTQIGQDVDGEAILDHSGCSVSLSSVGSVVAIGAWRNNGNGAIAGHVRIYKDSSGIWTQIGTDIDGEASLNYSGFSVSLNFDGSVVAIGAYGNGNNAGHVRIYKDISGTWTQVGNYIDGEAVDDLSGNCSLSDDGSIVAIGAPNNDGNGSGAGHVRIYKNMAGAWTQIGSDIDGESFSDNSGSAVSLSSNGSVVAIGAFYNGGHAGHVRIYTNPTIGVNELSNTVEVAVYPNPTKGKITIECEGMERVEVLNVAGKLVYEIAVSSDVLDIDISGFSKGVYFVKVSSGDGVGVERVVLE